MSLNRKKALAAATLANWAYFDKKKDDDVISVVLPDDLSTLTAEELTELRKSAIEAFNELYQGGKAELTKDQLKVLGDLKEAKLALDKEQKTRADDAKKAAAEAAAMAADMTDEVEDEEEVAEVEEIDDEAADEVVAEAEKVTKAAAKEEKKEPIAAAATPRAPINVARVKARQTPVVATEVKPASPFRAAVNVPDLQPGAEVDLDAIALAFANMTDSARPGPALAAKRSNTRFSQKHQVAHIMKPFDERAIADGDASAAIAFATDQTRLKSSKGEGSLVAAGGWCAPSETLYDLCQLESTDGILSVPEIQVNRGGIRFTQGPDWADIFTDTGFTFTEANDSAGEYSETDAVHTLTEGGAGLTSYTITFDGQTTGSIDDDATAAQVQAALEALSNIAPGDVVVTGDTNPIAMQLTWGGAYEGVNVPAPTTTPTGGTGTVVVATTTQGGQPGPKPCNIVPCPEFTDVRLDVSGVCIQSGILLNRAYPELVRRYVSGALTAHMHRVATAVLADMIAGSTAVTPTKPTGEDASVTAPLLSAIELQAEDIKYRYRMPRGTTLEAIFPFWARGAIRADLSRRQGVDMLSVTDAQIDGWFRARGINPQFIYNFDNLGTVTSGALVWPATLRFLIYPAGTWVKGSSDLITLSMLHDSTLNANNNFTAIFTEEGWSVMKMCHISRVVTVAICPGGQTGAAADYSCA